MKISGFTFIKNAESLYFPAKQAIESILPICDEFVIALGESDPGDKTLELIQSIGSDKIKIVNTTWDTATYRRNTIYAQQTDVAKSACSGDWLFYIQGDEAVHEDDLDEVLKACRDNLDNDQVEGFLFNYMHFWGDYWHYHRCHCWYRREIRLIRNLPNIHSWRDAQSFRKFDVWNDTFEDYVKKESSHKLKVKQLNARVFHYGYVRPPRTLSKKTSSASARYSDKDPAEQEQQTVKTFYYGPLQNLNIFTGSHPAAMKEWIDQFNWKDDLQYYGERDMSKPLYKHERLKYRILSYIEDRFLGEREIGGFKNYQLLR
ncbi:MAG: hypothetical protein OEZ43_01810 [Gammaproteobacteria bacterium]|nr:hypothetical protein [Gammaproteobacteria bacterium]